MYIINGSVTLCIFSCMCMAIEILTHERVQCKYICIYTALHNVNDIGHDLFMRTFRMHQQTFMRTFKKKVESERSMNEVLFQRCTLAHMNIGIVKNHFCIHVFGGFYFVE